MEIPPLSEVRRLTEKKRDAWWTVLLVDPVATPLVRWTAKYARWVTPNQITWAALFLGLGAGGGGGPGAAVVGVMRARPVDRPLNPHWLGRPAR
ncbi:hypothetical protein ACFW0U_15975, partial [Streptomyces albidoflavus]